MQRSEERRCTRVFLCEACSAVCEISGIMTDLPFFTGVSTIDHSCTVVYSTKSSDHSMPSHGSTCLRLHVYVGWLLAKPQASIGSSVVARMRCSFRYPLDSDALLSWLESDVPGDSDLWISEALESSLDSGVRNVCCTSASLVVLVLLLLFSFL